MDLNRSYRRVVAPFVFELRGEGRFGWRIRVTPLDEDRDLTSLLPEHGASSLDVGNRQAGDDLEVNRVAVHPFTFHPEARRTITYEHDTITMLVNDLRVRSYGRGRLTIARYETTTDKPPQFRWIEFNVCMSFPRR